MACQIFETSAKEADCISYTSKILVSTSLPCRNLNIGEFSRNNGHTRFTIHAPIEIGIPYGTYPRLLLIWIVTEAKKHKTREIYLGETVTEFIRNIGKAGSGGKTGSLTALREQAKRLFTSTITTTCNKKILRRFEISVLQKTHQSSGSQIQKVIGVPRSHYLNPFMKILAKVQFQSI